LSTNPRLPLGPTLVFVAGAWIVTTARAAEVIFRPVLLFGAYHDGNVLIIGETGETGDDVFTVAADIDLIRSTASSSWTFNYRPVYTMYRQNDELDYFGHSARVAFSKTYSGQSSFYADLVASRTDRQGVRPFRPDDPVNFVERNTETRADLRLGGTFTSGRRSLIDWQAGVGTTQYEVNTLDDSVTFGGGAGWRYAFSERDSLGFSLHGDGFLYDEVAPTAGEPPPAVDTGATTAHVVGKHNFSEFTVLDYGAGATYTDSDLQSDTSFSADVSITRKATEFTELSAGVRQGVGAGTGSGGATLDRGAWVAYRLLPARRGLEANVLAAFWQRDGEAINGLGAGSVTAWSSAETVGWAFNRYISTSLIHSFTDQNANADEPDVLDTSHHSYGVYVRWNISGR
jgi:hypothetical protein